MTTTQPENGALARSAIRFVLVEASHPGNIGAAARAMKNMDLDQLYLVSPACFPDARATARASGADDLLYDATICPTLEEAISGCVLVLGASARQRSLALPVLDPRAAGQKATQIARTGKVAVVFGPEQSGLSNAALDCCHYLVSIPANPEFGSLNLAMAVQILAYEILMARNTGQVSDAAPEAPAASTDEMTQLYAHLERVLRELEFLNPLKPRHLMRRLRRLFNRAELDKNELNILRGILSAIEARDLAGTESPPVTRDRR